MKTHTFTVNGMHCNSCKLLIEEELEDAGATDIAVTLDAAAQRGRVLCTSDKDRMELVALIEDLGDYKVTE